MGTSNLESPYSGSIGYSWDVEGDFSGFSGMAAYGLTNFDGDDFASLFATAGGLQTGTDAFDAFVSDWSPQLELLSWDGIDLTEITSDYISQMTNAEEMYNTWLTNTGPLAEIQLQNLDQSLELSQDILSQNTADTRKELRQNRDTALRQSVIQGQNAMNSAGQSGLAQGSQYSVYDKGIQNTLYGVNQFALQDKAARKAGEAESDYLQQTYLSNTYDLLSGFAQEQQGLETNIEHDMELWMSDFETGVSDTYNDWYDSLLTKLSSFVSWEYDVPGSDETIGWTLEGDVEDLTGG
jgi:hypothetical protein